MFDPNEYKSACEDLTLDGRRMAQIITAAERKTKRRTSPARSVLVAAAVAAAVGITAVAAVPRAREAVLSLFGFEMSVAVTEQGEALGVYIPDLSLEMVEDRVLLSVDGEVVDITDEVAGGAGYTYRRDYDDSTLEVELAPDLSCFTILCDKQDGSPVIVLSKPALNPQAAS